MKLTYFAGGRTDVVPAGVHDVDGLDALAEVYTRVAATARGREKDSAGHVCGCTFRGATPDEIDHLIEPARRRSAERDGREYRPLENERRARIEAGGYRASRYVDQVTWLFDDFDRLEAQAPDWRPEVWPCGVVAHSSHNFHPTDKPGKWRVAVALSRPCSLSEGRRLVRWLAGRHPDGQPRWPEGGHFTAEAFERQARSLVQPAFLPTCPADRGVQVVRVPGPALDVDTALAATPELATDVSHHADPAELAARADALPEAREQLSRTKLGRWYLYALDAGCPGLEVYFAAETNEGGGCTFVRSPFADRYTTATDETHFAIVGDEGVGGVSSFHATDPKDPAEHFKALEALHPRLRHGENPMTLQLNPEPPTVEQIQGAAAPLAVQGAAQASGWSPHTQDLTGAPSRVQRALERWRRDQAGGGIARPQLQESAACLRWLALDARVPALDLARWFGEQAGRLAAELQREAANPQVQCVGRLAQIDAVLSQPSIELRYNEMSLTIEINGRPWSDADTADARLACEQAGVSEPNKPVPNGDIEQRAKRLACRNSYHPVREYFDSLPEWDRTVRLESLWVRYFGADATARNHALGVCFALGAVRRVLYPGCKVDMMPILYGLQGKLKSTAIEALAGKGLFSDAKLNFSHRAENAMTLAECWILEVAELEGFNRAEQTAVKAFTTVKVDRVLLPYARVKTERPRMSVMIGTTNEDRPLKDPTGNRRYPVIAVGSIDVAAITADRDQLWAEALLRGRGSEPHWLSPELEAQAAEANQAHTETDEAWIDKIRRWLAQPTRPGSWRPEPFAAPTFTTADVLECALHIEPGRHGRSEQIRVGLALKALGYASRTDGRVRWYSFEHPAEPWKSAKP